MTICIAAIGWDGNNEKLIFATDHMITTGTGQFEQSITKYKEINSQTVVMLAGQTLLFGDLIKLDTNDLKSYDSIKGRIYRNFLDKRKEVIVNEILNIYGLSHVQLIDALQKPITNPFLQSIFEKVSNFRLNTSILLIGFKDKEAQITEINEVGIFEFRDLNFHAIGSGNSQAINTLMFQKHSKKDSLMKTAYNVYKAKKNAEVMQGVGKETDMLVLSDNLKQIAEKDIKILNNIYVRELNFGKENRKLNNLEL